jgi:hypothetical protein
MSINENWRMMWKMWKMFMITFTISSCKIVISLQMGTALKFDIVLLSYIWDEIRKIIRGCFRRRVNNKL